MRAGERPVPRAASPTDEDGRSRGALPRRRDHQIRRSVAIHVVEHEVHLPQPARRQAAPHRLEADRVHERRRHQLGREVEAEIVQLFVQVGALLASGGVPLRGQPGRLRLHLLPPPAQRRHQHRLDDQQDVVLAGVMRPQLRALGGVQTTLEECAEDGRLDRAPIQRIDAGDGIHGVAVQLQHQVIVEQTAVEVADLIRTEVTAFLHGAEQLAKDTGEIFGIATGLIEQAREQLFGQQTDILGKQAK